MNMEARTCLNPFCGSTFTPKPKAHHQRFCCRRCAQKYRDNAHWLGEGPSSRVFFRPCKRCGVTVSMRAKAHDKALCEDCRREWYRAHNARKSHQRRAAGRLDMTVRELAERDGRRCHICHRVVDLTLKGTAKMGPTIDHLLPVSKGGTNASENLALAHRVCNTSRGNTGAAQLLLIA